MGRPIAALGRPRDFVLLGLALLLGAVTAPGTLAAPPVREDGTGPAEPVVLDPALATVGATAAIPAEPTTAVPGTDQAAPASRARRKPAPRAHASPSARSGSAPEGEAEADDNDVPTPAPQAPVRLDDPVLR